MNRYQKIFVVLLFVAFALDAGTFAVMAFAGNIHLESNPFKVLYGDGAVWLPVFYSFAVAWLLYWLISRKAGTDFRRGLTAVVVGNVVYAKVLASLANLYFGLQGGVLYANQVTSSEWLLVSYALFVGLFLLSPLVFNALFFWLFWNGFKAERFEVVG